MRILGQVEGKRRDDARAWKLPMPVAGTNSTAKCRVPTDSFRARAYTSGVPERDAKYQRGDPIGDDVYSMVRDI